MGRISSIAKAIIVGKKFWVFFASFLFIFSAVGAEGWSTYNAVESFVEVHLSTIFGKTPCVISVWLTQLCPGSKYSYYYFSQFLAKHSPSYFAQRIFGNTSLAPFRLEYGYVVKGGATIKVFKKGTERTLIYGNPPVMYFIINDSSPYYLYLCHQAGASKGEAIILTSSGDFKGISRGSILCSSPYSHLCILSNLGNRSNVTLQDLTEKGELPVKIAFMGSTSPEFWKPLLLGLTLYKDVSLFPAFVIIPSHYIKNWTYLGAPNLYYLTVNGGITSLEELIKLWNINKIVEKNLKKNFKNFTIESEPIIVPELNVKSPPLEKYEELFSVPPSWSSAIFVTFLKKHSVEGFSILLTYSLMIASLSSLIILLLTLISRRKMNALFSLGASSNLIATAFSLSILGVASASLIIVGILEVVVLKIPLIIYLEYLSLPQLAFIGIFSYLFARYNLKVKEPTRWSTGAVWIAVLLFIGASVIAIWGLPSQGIAREVEILQLFIVIIILCVLLAFSLLRWESKRPWRRSKISLLVRGALGKETVLGMMAIIVAASASSALYMEGPIFMAQKANELSWLHLMCDLKITGPPPVEVSKVISKFGAAFIVYYPLNNLLYLTSYTNNAIQGVIPINLTQLNKICTFPNLPKYERELFQKISKYLTLGPHIGLMIEPGETWSEKRVIEGNYTLYYIPEGAPSNLPHLHLKIYEITCPREIYAVYSKLFYGRGSAIPVIIRYSDFKYLGGNITGGPQTVYYIFFKERNPQINQIKKELSKIGILNAVFRKELAKEMFENYMKEEREILQEVYLFLLYVSAIVVLMTLNVGKALKTRIRRIENLGASSYQLSTILALSIALSSAIGVLLALAPIMVATPWISKSTFSLYQTFIEYPVKFSLIGGGVAFLSCLLTFYGISRRRSAMEVKLKNVKKSYWIGKNKVEAIRGISASFSSKKLNVIMGPSGSGKTTLLNLIAGILIPDAGDVIVLGRNLKEMTESERASFRLLNIGYVFQEFGLLPDLTVGENIALPMILAKKDRKEIQEKIPELMRKVGLKEEYMSRYPDELSGGEQQRVAIARALSNDPKILLADEPTSNLDTETGRRIVALLTEISKERTVIVSTHDPEILKGSEKILKIRDGKIVGGS